MPFVEVWDVRQHMLDRADECERKALEHAKAGRFREATAQRREARELRDDVAEVDKLRAEMARGER